MIKSAMPGLIRQDDRGLLDLIEAGGHWTIVSSINFEECALGFVRNCLDAMSDSAIERTNFLLLRLESAQATRWSALEIVKSAFEQEVRDRAMTRDANLKVQTVGFPVSRDIIVSVIADACPRERGQVVIDISGFPREMATFALGALYGASAANRRLPGGRRFAVVTNPRHTVGREALGPSSVGRPRPVYNDRSAIRQITREGRTTALIFCGPEGFEARHVVDELRGPGTRFTTVFELDAAAVDQLLPGMAANQSLLLQRDELNLSIRYSMDSDDNARIAEAIVGDAVATVEQDIEQANALIIAPFGSKVNLIAAAYCCARFSAECSAREADNCVYDVMVLGSSQYTSLHSHGCADTVVFELTFKG